jgi:hypothetical protein
MFDMAPGNLFVVRNAGNSIESVGLGSLEFAAAVLGVSLIAVIGHTECGAVIATEDSVKTGELPPPSIDSVVEAIAPAVEALPAGATTNDAIAANARYPGPADPELQLHARGDDRRRHAGDRLGCVRGGQRTRHLAAVAIPLHRNLHAASQNFDLVTPAAGFGVSGGVG